MHFERRLKGPMLRMYLPAVRLGLMRLVDQLGLVMLLVLERMLSLLLLLLLLLL